MSHPFASTAMPSPKRTSIGGEPNADAEPATRNAKLREIGATVENPLVKSLDDILLLHVGPLKASRRHQALREDLLRLMADVAIEYCPKRWDKNLSQEVADANIRRRFGVEEEEA